MTEGSGERQRGRREKVGRQRYDGGQEGDKSKRVTDMERPETEWEIIESK